MWALYLIFFLYLTHPRVCAGGGESGGGLRVGGWLGVSCHKSLCWRSSIRKKMHSGRFLLMKQSWTARRAEGVTTWRTAACWQAAQTLPPYPVWLMQPNEAKWRLIVIRERGKENERMRNNVEPSETTVRAEGETVAAPAACTKWEDKTWDSRTESDCLW